MHASPKVSAISTQCMPVAFACWAALGREATWSATQCAFVRIRLPSMMNPLPVLSRCCFVCHGMNLPWNRHQSISDRPCKGVDAVAPCPW